MAAGDVRASAFLGNALDRGNLQATYDQGVLTLAILVAERAKPRRIEVGSGQGEPRTIEGTFPEGGSQRRYVVLGDDARGIGVGFEGRLNAAVGEFEQLIGVAGGERQRAN